MSEIIFLSDPNAQTTHAQRRARRREVVTLVREYQALFGEVCFTPPPSELESHQVFQKIQGPKGTELLQTISFAISGLQAAKSRRENSGTNINAGN